MEAKVTKTAKPSKPVVDKDFPLWAHPSGRWCRKIKGRVFYFGKVGDPDAALAKWLEQKDDLLAGRKPRPKSDGWTVADLCNHFLGARQRKLDAGELEYRTWLEYRLTAERVIEAFGRTRSVDDLRPDDFGTLRAAIAKKWGKVALSNEIQRVRTIFKHGFDNHLLDRPVRFGTEFVKPSAKQRRQERLAKPAKMLSADEIRAAIDNAPLQLKAMILLGINCGFGNTDCATLPITAIDFKRKMIDYPRPKTAVIRRAPLWPETLDALKDVLAKRYEPTDEADKPLLFITKQRNRWSRFNEEVRIDSVSREFGKLLRQMKMKREGVGFYSLRHVFETIGGETGDQPAVDRIMGHHRDDMASVYREWVADAREDARLKKVTDHIRRWLLKGQTKTR